MPYASLPRGIVVERVFLRRVVVSPQPISPLESFELAVFVSIENCLDSVGVAIIEVLAQTVHVGYIKFVCKFLLGVERLQPRKPRDAGNRCQNDQKQAADKGGANHATPERLSL